MIGVRNTLQKIVVKGIQQLEKQTVHLMQWLCWKQMDEHFAYAMVVMTVKLPYLEHTLPIEKLLEQKKFLKALPITQGQALLHNKRVPIFVLLKILKNRFSKTKIFITNNNDFLDGLTHIQALMRTLFQENHWFVKYHPHFGPVERLFFAGRLSKRTLKVSWEVLLLDCTHKTNPIGCLCV